MVLGDCEFLNNAIIRSRASWSDDHIGKKPSTVD